MKIALVHDFLTQLGGAERVLEEFHHLFPEAPVYTLVYDSQKLEGRYDNWDIRTSFIDRLPGGRRYYKWYLSLMPKAVESLDLRDFDIIVSDASAYAQGVIPPKGVRHICYCHTPTRYLWQMQKAYLASQPYPWFVKQAARPILQYLKSWDRKAAQRVDFFIANSHEVKTRIEQYYGRSSEVIYPPVNTDFFTPVSEQRKDYFLSASRLEPYKRIDLVVEEFNRSGKKLIVAGDGTAVGGLKSKAAANIRFLGRVNDEQLRDLYRGAKAFVFPAHEDAGIMILEALSCGTPVVAFGAGGAKEFIKDGVHGVLFDSQDKRALQLAIERCENIKFNISVLRTQALKFSATTFREQMLSKIKTVYENSN